MLDINQTNYLLKMVAESTLKLLIIEDMAEDMELIVLALESGGVNFKCDTAETATECRKLLENCQYDAVLSDYRLPGFNGLEVLKLMQELGQDIPLILVTGSLGEEAAVEVANSLRTIAPRIQNAAPATRSDRPNSATSSARSDLQPHPPSHALHPCTRRSAANHRRSTARSSRNQRLRDLAARC